MDKFRDAYREASKELPQISISAEEIRDELHHRRMQRQSRKILMAKGCAAAAVFLLCGVGTVAAKNYRDSMITVRENGFVITSSQEEPNLSEGQFGGLLDIASFLKEGGVFSIADAVPEVDTTEYFEPEIAEYDSVDAFLAAEDMTVLVPDKNLLGRDFTRERVCVIGEEDIHMDFMDEDSYFSLHQMDNRKYESYSSATAYSGQSCNERSFTNSQGLNYVVFDTVDETGNRESVHAVISVNGWDLTVSFGGFEEDEIERVLKGLDLTVFYGE
ncbi:MAG: hypothetical protein HFH97_00520 [Lachnospiraceae bacterium]|nr:hypothetical protein [uncultured Acetatifactor sp.]MCI9571088.1 hypothetical protein [Lachnospiraceae bacterium]